MAFPRVVRAAPVLVPVPVSLPVLVLVLVLMASPLTTGFNVDTAHPVIFRGPVTDPTGRQTRADTYFGYSVSLGGVRESDGPWLLAGAPRANSTLGPNPPSRVLEPGAVFKCPLRRGAACQEVLVDRTGNVPDPERQYTDLKDQGWLGGAMEYASNGWFATSAFRWRNTKYPNKYLGNGVCYVGTHSVSDDSFRKEVPLYDKNSQNYILPDRRLEYFYSYGEAGTSLHFPDNGHELILGAPGVFDWTGTIIRYSEVDDLTVGPTIPNPYLTKTLQNNDYFGYSVGSGRFSSDSHDTLYLAGAPRGAEGKGRALLVDFPLRNDQPFSIKADWVGSSLGEYFGAAVLAVDINGDGLSDVVVGAPLFQDGFSVEQGRIYVYINADHGLFKSARTSVGSGVSHARFGSTLASLGDIDNDGFFDFAVGAPYEEDGRGAVYVFRGGPGDFVTTASQRIAASELNADLRGFGISLSRGVDVDGNRYPDVAVGSYASGDAVLLRTRPVLQFAATLSAQPEKLEADTREFEVQACLSYDGPFLPMSVRVNVTLKIESFHAQSVLVVGGEDVRSSTDVWQLSASKATCRTYSVAIRSQDRIDVTKPIQLSMRYNLPSDGALTSGENALFIDTDTRKRPAGLRRKRRQIEFPSSLQGIDDFCSSCPVQDTSKNNQQMMTLMVPFANGCGPDSVCRTDLHLSFAFPDLSDNVYVIGSTKTLELELKLTNGGEPASLPSLTVMVPSPVTLMRIPPACEEDKIAHGDTKLTCSVQPHPFLSDSKFEISIPLDVSSVTSKFTSLKFNVSATSTGEEQTPGDNVANITLGLLSQADMEIVGKAFQDEVLYTKEEELTEDNRDKAEYLDIQHTYQILKYLPTPVERVSLSFLVPVNITIAGKPVNFLRMYPPTALLGGEPFSCSLQDGDVLRSGGPETPAHWSQPTTAPSRRRRSADGPADGAPAASDAYPLRCLEGSDIQCARIACQTVSFLNTVTQATVTLSMRLDAAALRPRLGGADGASLVTEGEVRLLEGSHVPPEFNSRPDTASVATRLLPSTPEAQPVAAWIIVVSVLAALALLAGIVFGMYRLGFFKRTKRDQLLEERDGAAGETDKLNSGEQ
ncbi:integrin alpha-PS3-like [Amphibalanus amphitrite]|uniref:integrin alpha-PS3-like n=1 Tax=Amphibalanus amphitrite TaxID=1232801 RepID=UPI001C924F51|nr:integrin alpha-PS3-like [Amphibalanus amphitrite]